MGRIRTIKPEFFRSRSLSRCSLPARLTFQGLWCEADDHGRGIADPRLIVAAVWPLDDDVTALEVESHLDELVKSGHIDLYHVDGERYYAVSSWEKHQSAAYRRGEALHPAPPAETSTHDESCKEVQDARPVVLEGKGREQGTGKPPAPLALVVDDPSVIASFEEFWTRYPERKGKKLEKAKAKDQWMRLCNAERAAAYVGAGNYAEADVLAKDAYRWLRDKSWLEWMDVAEAVSYVTPKVRYT